ncbi:hypothetical protein GWI33_020766 [Rhynchophorus ferrugineus]|uniref:HMG box domain-containing protein n=1 Tax=Rhynchophorus ferrugineus TaxID=354439 RepID=A0A834HNN6_RHYFE|nr:hypothetical protein GWI33_020766 [Rhynchophorus ferrugineus]
MSDDSENDVGFEENHDNDVYYNKYKLLLEECSQLQRANEILVFRIQEVNKITKRRHKEVNFFRQRLLRNYGEDWSIIPPDILSDEEEDIKPAISNILSKDKIKQEKNEDGIRDKSDRSKSDKVKSSRKPARKKGSRPEKDPNAPKRPSNPFFQFCQEQRQILLEQITADLKPGETEPSKRELTRQLALKWGSLSAPDKKIYVDRYEKSKEKYHAEMEDYKKTK